MMKENCGLDSVWGWLHVLMLMADTIILATSCYRCVAKLRFCSNSDLSGKVINENLDLMIRDRRKILSGYNI